MSELQKKRLFIVDDHRLVAVGFESLLKDVPGFEIVGISHTPADVLHTLETTPVDILLTDVSMPGLSGVELTLAIKKKFPQVKVLALSMFCEGLLVAQMVNAGVAGYMVKGSSKRELVEALTRIAGGETYFSPEITQALSKALKASQQEGTGPLTNREIEIIQLINKEFSNKAIAQALFISERTVETHRKNIFRKTNTQSVVGLLRYAREQMLI